MKKQLKKKKRKKERKLPTCASPATSSFPCHRSTATTRNRCRRRRSAPEVGALREGKRIIASVSICSGGRQLTVSPPAFRATPAALHDHHRRRHPQLCGRPGHGRGLLPVLEVRSGHVAGCALPRAAARAGWVSLNTKSRWTWCLLRLGSNVVPYFLLLPLPVRRFCHFAPQRPVGPQGAALERRQRLDLLHRPLHCSVGGHGPRHQAVDRRADRRALPLRGSGWYGEYLTQVPNETDQWRVVIFF